MTFRIENVKRASLVVEEEQVRALIGALSYFNSSAANNFQAGYAPGNSEDQELAREHLLARQMEETLVELLEAMEGEN